jgi:glycosyltransferase involved in cell wall biosynthesis
MIKNLEDYKITCILPNLNGAKYLEKTIISFLSQTVKNKKLIIVDGNSRDKSHDIIKNYTKYSSIMWLKYKDNGLYDAYKQGFKYLDFSKNEIYCQLGSDDILKNNIYKNVISNFKKNKDIDGLYYDYEIINLNNKTYEKEYKKCCSERIDIKSLKLKGNIAAGHTVFLKSFFLKYFLYPAKYQYANDYYLYIYLLKKKFIFKYVPQPATISYYGNNITAKNIWEGAKESIKIYYKMFGVDTIFFYRLILLVKARITTLAVKILKK